MITPSFTALFYARRYLRAIFMVRVLRLYLALESGSACIYLAQLLDANVPCAFNVYWA